NQHAPKLYRWRGPNGVAAVPLRRRGRDMAPISLNGAPSRGSKTLRAAATPPQSSSAFRFTAGASGFLELEPMARPAGNVWRAEPLQHDDFAASLQAWRVRT